LHFLIFAALLISTLSLTLSLTSLCFLAVCVRCSTCVLSAQHRWGSVALCVSQTWRAEKWGERRWLSQFVCLTNLSP
jgi:hypothetical protein